MNYYVYLITNLVNGKIYVGQHYGKRTLDAYFRFNLQAAFLPSCWNKKKILYSAVRKYGPENFALTILFQPSSLRQTNRLERFLIRQLNARDPNVGYNIAEGGSCGMSTLGRKLTEEHKQAVSRAHKGKPKSAETRRRMSLGKKGIPNPGAAEANKRRRHPNPTTSVLKTRRCREYKRLRALGLYTIMPMGNGCLGRKASEETKKKMSEAQKARFQKEKLGVTTTGHKSPQGTGSD